jgi:hypothetical protein
MARNTLAGDSKQAWPDAFEVPVEDPKESAGE